jgi:hypothetical protein
MSSQSTLRRSAFQACKFCKDLVNLDDEGVQYRDGSAAHEECDDCNSFNQANAGDFRD